ncbi:BA75_03318T0 [Komagataella pastoris]|uniref:BA75_03318T0 n=1 Tax=Komagataella pastoris TaxID=4922 RepID=A0A1B2JA87_PICPA|nr:BA75_03318T0 [Komagataella pastoris]
MILMAEMCEIRSAMHFRLCQHQFSIFNQQTVLYIECMSRYIIRQDIIYEMGHIKVIAKGISMMITSMPSDRFPCSQLLLLYNDQAHQYNNQGSCRLNISQFLAKLRVRLVSMPLVP